MNGNTGTELGARLKAARTAQGATQSEIAARFKITQPSYQRWESGQTSPDPSQYETIAHFLSSTPAEVFRMIHGGAPTAPITQTLRDDIDDIRSQLDELTQLI
jgi:transcriptional regulator with XRE-family HTH domain